MQNYACNAKNYVAFVINGLELHAISIQMNAKPKPAWLVYLLKYCEKLTNAVATIDKFCAAH